jgi:hypothetical protein
LIHNEDGSVGTDNVHRLAGGIGAKNADRAQIILTKRGIPRDGEGARV